MAKHKNLHNNNLYLGIGGVIAVAALVLALTFGLSNAQDSMQQPPQQCPQGMMGTPPNCTAPQQPTTCPQGMTGTPPNCTASQAPQQPQSVQCPNGTQAQTMDQCPKCPNGSMMPAGGQCPQTQPQPTTCPAGMTGVPPACVPSNTTAPTWGTPPPGGCQAPTSYWNGTSCIAPLVPSTTPNTTPPAAGCGQGMYWNGTMCVSSAPTMRVCGPNEMPTAQNPCMMSQQQMQQMPQCDWSTQYMKMSTPPVCAPKSNCTTQGSADYNTQECQGVRGMNFTPAANQQGTQSTNQGQQNMDCFNPSSPSFASQSCTQMRANQNQIMVPQNNQFHNAADMQGNFGPQGFGPQGNFFPGQQGNFGQNGMPTSTATQNGPMQFVDPCQANPNDPFCKAGFNVGPQQNLQFDPNQFQQQNNFNAQQLKMQARNLKQQVAGWKRDVSQVRSQLKEVSRSSSGFACPSIVEVDALATQWENAISTANSITSSSSDDDIKKALAMQQFVDGNFDQQSGEQTPGVRQQLFGGPPNPDTGEQTPGKMQSLNVCREISGQIAGACNAAKFVGQEYDRIKKQNGSAEVLAVFADVSSQLQTRCKNPLDALQKAGVSFDTLSSWRPDPDLCSFGGPGQGGPGFGGPGFGPGQGGPGFGGPGPMGPGSFGNMTPEMMNMMQQKMQQFQKTGGFNGSFGTPFSNSLLTVPSTDNSGNQDSMGDSAASDNSDACMSPVQKYLGIQDLMMKLDDARNTMQQQSDVENACQMFDMSRSRFDAESKLHADQFDPDTLAQIKTLLFTDAPAACKSGNADDISSLRDDLFSLFQQGGQSSGDAFNNIVNVDQLAQDNVEKQLSDLTGAKDQELADLKAKLADLTNQFSDLQKTALALKEQVATLTAHVAAAVSLDANGQKALGNIAVLPDQAVQQEVTTGMSDIVQQVGDVEKVLSNSGDTQINDVVNHLMASPPTADAALQIKADLTDIASYAQSGASEKEILSHVQDKAAEMLAVNGLDVTNKVKQGLCAAGDVCDLSQWYANPVREAQIDGFVADATQLQSFKPAEAESKCAAITRVARVLEKVGDVQIDTANTTPIDNAPEWCRPFVHALADKGIDFAKNLTDPNAPADRVDVAILMHEALGDKLPTPPNPDQFLTPDVQNLSADAKAAVAAVRFNGIMDTVDGKNFGPMQALNRAQHSLITVKEYGVVKKATTPNQPQ